MGYSILEPKNTWCNLPSEYGKDKGINRRFNRWRNQHIWDDILVVLLTDSRFKWLLIDDC